MSQSGSKLRVGFIPLVDSASLLLAVDKGFTAEQGLDVELIREVSWANIREKLNAGYFDAAHMLTPMAIASTLGIGQPVQTSLLAPMTLAINGNAITVSHRLYKAIADETGGGMSPLATAQGLAKVIEKRAKLGMEPLTFGMTFPFSSHNYQLRLWMAAGGIDPEEDVHLIVLPPPYMVESLENGQVDGFCVGAPWNSLAVDLGIGCILHLGSEIVNRLAEKVLAVRANWANAQNGVLIRLMTAVMQGADYALSPDNQEEASSLLAMPNRVGVKAHLIKRALSGNLRTGAETPDKSDRRYLIPARGFDARPDLSQADWYFKQILRWRQTNDPATAGVDALRAVFSPAVFDQAFPNAASQAQHGGPEDGIGVFGTTPPA